MVDIVASHLYKYHWIDIKRTWSGYTYRIHSGRFKTGWCKVRFTTLNRVKVRAEQHLDTLISQDMHGE